jgi:uncharacterized protein YegL
MPRDGKGSELEAEGIEPQLEWTPTVLILDTSGSMGNKTETPDGQQRPKIDQLNDGLETFHQVVSGKEHANKRVDVAIVTFGGKVTVEQEFTPFNNWSPPTLNDSDNTPMGSAIERATDLVQERKDQYNEDGISYNRPLLWLLTDGKPTDMDEDDQTWNDIQTELEDGARENHFEFFAMGVSGANMETLNDLVKEPTGRPALKIKEGMFEEYFEFLSNSLETASDPNSGDSYELDQDKLGEFVQVD